MRWWSWAAGRQSRQAVVRKWLTEDFGSVRCGRCVVAKRAVLMQCATFLESRLQNAPLLVAASAGPALGVAFMAYNLLYNTTVVRRLAAFTLGRALHCR